MLGTIMSPLVGRREIVLLVVGGQQLGIKCYQKVVEKFASLLIRYITRYINPNVSGSSLIPNFILQYPFLQNVAKLFFLSKGKTFMLSSAHGMKKPLLCNRSSKE